MTIRKIPGKEFFEQPFHTRDVDSLSQLETRVKMQGFRTKIIRETKRNLLVLRGERDTEVEPRIEVFG